MEITVPTVHSGSMRPGFRFAASFMLSAAAATALMAYAPQVFADFWVRLTIAITRVAGYLTGLAVLTTGDVIVVNGFPMRVIFQCTAVHYIAIVSSAILMSRWHSLRYRIAGVLAAVPLLVLLNSFRVLFTGLAGSISRTAFDFVHRYLWVTAFVLLACAVWALWDKRLVLPVFRLNCFAFLAIALCSLFQLLLFIGSYQVDILMSLLASAVLELLPGTSGQAIEMYAGRAMFIAGERYFTFSISAELVVLTVYAGLTAAEVIDSGVRSSVRLVTGGLLLLLLCLLIITSCCPVIAFWGRPAATLYLWVSQGVMLALPLGTWWMLRRSTPGPA